VILFGNWIGALIYFFIRRRERLNPSRTGPWPASKTVAGSPLQHRAASIPMDAKIIPQAIVPPPAAASSVARSSDWTHLRLLLVIFGVLVVLPTALVVVMYGVMFVMFISSVREDSQKVREHRTAAKDGYADFQKRVAVQQEEFQKRVAEQQAAQKKRASMTKVRAEPTGTAVTGSTPLRAGDEVLCSWGLHWYRTTVLEIQPGGDVKIHWNNWDDFFDEVVPRDRLQLPASAVGEEQAGGK
jgi:hypothetical protein